MRSSKQAHENTKLKDDVLSAARFQRTTMTAETSLVVAGKEYDGEASFLRMPLELFQDCRASVGLLMQHNRLRIHSPVQKAHQLMLACIIMPVDDEDRPSRHHATPFIFIRFIRDTAKIQLIYRSINEPGRLAYPLSKVSDILFGFTRCP